MLPPKLLSSSAELYGSEVRPRYLGARDYPWLLELIERYQRCIGRPRRELQSTLAKPLALPSPRNKRRIAAFVLEAQAQDRPIGEPGPELVRRELFARARPRTRARAEVLLEVASELGTNVGTIEAQLFGDVAGERLIDGPARSLGPSRLAEDANFAIVGSLLRRASRVVVEASGDTRALIRHAHRHGLICTVTERGPSPRGVRLELSGPFALFRHTHLYGKALGSLLPRLTWCEHFVLSANCALRGAEPNWTFHLRSGDPIGVARPVVEMESVLERRFVRDFVKATSDWDLLPAPAPRSAGAYVISADFELVHRSQPGRRALVQIVGYWTPEHLQAELARAGAGDLPPLVLCADESKACGRSGSAAPPRVVLFRSRIDVAAVLAALEQ